MASPRASIVPRPAHRRDGDGYFRLSPETVIECDAIVRPVAECLAKALRTISGLSIDVVSGSPTSTGNGNIALILEPGHAQDAYELTVRTDGIRIAAQGQSGLFAGIQSLRQLPPAEGMPTAEWKIPATHIEDHPRFTYRGAMLDVARHFFGVDDVKRYIDAIALLKFNVLHLHLTDDQGWRLEIDGWPRLTEHGGSTQVGGGGGGFYTQEDFREIVAFAQARFITIVPEIDMPGHTNAALASYPELACDGHAPELYEGIEVGFSSLCIDKERTYEFIEEVLGQVAALTPGPWIHIGGDEALATPEADHLRFIARASAIASRTGKTVIGWHEMGRSSELPAGTIGQYWNFIEPENDAAQLAKRFVDGGGKLIMSPADVAYLDMKYDESSPLGLVWAKGPTSLEDAYGWDPAGILPGIGDAEILGVEAPLWTETLSTFDDLTTMAFPRIAAIAEIAWSPADEHDFADFTRRLAAFTPHLDALGIAHHRDAVVHPAG